VRSRRVVARVVAGLVVALVPAGCTDDSTSGDASASSTSAPDTSAATSTTSTPEPGFDEFTGSIDDFYVVPDPLPVGEPGELIRIQDVDDAGADGGERSVRIMYHSVDAAGRDRATTGTVTVPVDTDEDAGGLPVVTVAPGTVGLASKCALSRTGAPVLDVGVPAVRAMTDYIGMGPAGETMPYLSRESEGHSVLDAARAARQLAGDTSREVAIVGHSQGGHGAQSAHELASSYAPELDVVGTVSLAPAAMFDRTYGGVDDIVSRIVTSMSLYGLATEHDDLRFGDYVNAETAEAGQVMATDCVDTVIATLAPLAARPDYWTADPTITEPAATVLKDNDVGHVAAEAPLLLVGGTADERVVPQRVQDLFRRLCTTGQATQLIMLDGADHGTEVPRALPQIGRWLTDRFAGAAATDDCS
jgi:hypothetical protein